jgi:hypothetical protein
LFSFADGDATDTAVFTDDDVCGREL